MIPKNNKLNNKRTKISKKRHNKIKDCTCIRAAHKAIGESFKAFICKRTL